MRSRCDLIVLSHLRWDFVWQRPQHLLTRLAKYRRVIFIEEPVSGADGEPRWELQKAAENVVVCRLHSPEPSLGFSDSQIKQLRAHLPDLLAQLEVNHSIAWFYTPMAFPLHNVLPQHGIVYDCMDELSAFSGAPPEMLLREAELLRSAQLVFTGGPSLYEAKKNRHPNVSCFPSSVDAEHFKQAKMGIPEIARQAKLPHPRLGFFGVIDERFDTTLLASLANARPDWQFVIVGPVVKISPTALPQRENIHYFGQCRYEDLPAYLVGWDVCLLPFALNESTRFISPTKTLEYMAAERPIVSTPITDVAKPYGDIVYLGNNAETFLAGCERALHAPAREKESRCARMREVLSATSWNKTAQKMNEMLDRLNSSRSVSSLFGSSPLSPLPSDERPMSQTASPWSDRSPPVLVIGAGPTGLSAAYHLGEDALLLERNSQVGGWCRSIKENGFTFDFAGHIMFSNDPYVKEMYQTLLGNNVHWQDREAWIYSQEIYTRYPFQGSLYGLPPQVIRECILGAIEAQYGKGGAKSSHNGNGNGNGHGNGNGVSEPKPSKNGLANGIGSNHCAVTDCCADGILESTAPVNRAAAGEKPPAPRNFEEFIYNVWGAGIAKHFAIPYNTKLWAVPLCEMETSWLGGRVPMPDLGEMIEGALLPAPKPMGPNARFGYPLQGGFQALMDGFLPLLKRPPRLEAHVTRIIPSEHRVVLQDGDEYRYEQLISTMPLPVLIQQIGDEAPAEVHAAASRLRHVSVRCVHLGIGRERLTDKHWIYYPGDTVFHRIFVQGSASPHCNAPGGFGLTCEITYHPIYKPLPCHGDALIQRCIADCLKVGIFGPDDPIWAATQVDLPHAYVVYDHERLRNVTLIREWLAKNDILLSGRYSEWEYYNSDHAFLAGKKAAEVARQQLQAFAADSI